MGEEGARMGKAAWPWCVARWFTRRRPGLPLSAAAHTIASWDAATRLQTRGQLLWLAQQITEARRMAQAALDQSAPSPVRLPDALDITVPPQLRAPALPDGAEQLAAAVNRVRHDAERLSSATPRSARGILQRLADDLTQADKWLDRAGNDVCGADLSAADLTHLYLGGLRWDAATQWPAGWRDQLRATSDPVDGGHQVRDN
ncbi:hypothetical protein [Streptomyces noursei]|uniref:hypothetical protein n=1 Tax=Streptomyces noursei TaxID=1971 RepID=UPI0037F88B47